LSASAPTLGLRDTTAQTHCPRNVLDSVNTENPVYDTQLVFGSRWLKGAHQPSESVAFLGRGAIGGLLVAALACGAVSRLALFAPGAASAALRRERASAGDKESRPRRLSHAHKPQRDRRPEWRSVPSTSFPFGGSSRLTVWLLVVGWSRRRRLAGARARNAAHRKGQNGIRWCTSTSWAGPSSGRRAVSRAVPTAGRGDVWRLMGGGSGDRGTAWSNARRRSFRVAAGSGSRHLRGTRFCRSVESWTALYIERFAPARFRRCRIVGPSAALKCRGSSP